MATKLNRKFILVVGGFSAAAVLLLVAALLVNQLWIKNADRHIRSGDELMSQSKYREAYSMYGRAVAKKPEVVAYVAKMEEALGKVVAANPAQAAEDYRNLMQLKRARTRAQPGDPEQWRLLIDALEAESELYSRGEGWIGIEAVAKEMKESMTPGSDGARQAEEMMLFARAQRAAVLTSGERTELERQLEAFAKANPRSWRAWGSIVELRSEDVARLRGAGQDQAAGRRLEQLDKSLGEMRKALDAADPRAKATLAAAELSRIMLDGRIGSSIDRSKVDQARLAAAADDLASAARSTGLGRVVRSAAGQLVEARDATSAIEFLESWSKDHPADLIGGSFELEYASRAGDPDKGFDRVSAVARRILDTPELPTSLEASIQSDVRARALQVLIESAIMQGARNGADAAAKAELEKQLPDLRAKLLACLQNDESAPGLLQADAKILQSRGDLSGAAKKWETFFSKVPQPPADAFLWATLVYRAQNDLGLAMQTATRGSAAYPSDIRLIVQRAELSASLGRFAEAAALFDGLAKAVPSEPRFARAAAEARARAGTGQASEVAAEIGEVEEAIRAKDWARARELVAKWVESSGGSMQSMYARALVEQEAGDRAKALEYVREAMSRHQPTPELARLEAMLATEDPIERLDMMVARLVPDEKQRPAERLRLLRSLRADAERQVAEMKRADSPDLAKSEDFLAKIVAALGETEKQVGSSNDSTPQMIEIAFSESLSRGDFAAAELHVAAASRVSGEAPLLEPMLRSRLLDAQGRTAEAIQLLDRLRQSGRNEAMIAAQLALLQERSGNEPGAMALWKEAYERRPNDTINVRGYARAMGRSGQGKQALDMLRAAVGASPSDMDLVMLAAEFEAVYGSRAKAIELRQRALQLDGGNRDNLGELYLLLNLPADFGSVRDAQGRPRFDERTWAAVPVDEQRRLLSDAQRNNADAANRLYEVAMKAAPYDLRFAGRKAALLREAGKPAEARQSLDEVMARIEADGKAKSQAYVDHALLLESIGEREAADAALAKAATSPDAKARDLEFVKVEVVARRGDTKKAAEMMKAAVGTEPTVPVLLRLADLQVVSGAPAAAAETLVQLRPLLGTNPKPELVRQVEMLSAAVAASEADVLREAGKRDEAKAKADEALAALTRAQAAVPTDMNASLRRVELLRGQAIAQQDQSKYDAAVAEADRALARSALLWPMVSLRADLALDRRDIKSAIGIVERYLEAQPSNEDARIRVMDMQLAAANAERAVAAAREGAALRPTDPAWAERLGDIYVATGDQAAAAAEFERAFALEPTSLAFLEKAALARLGAGGSGEALSLLRGANDLVQRSPALGAIAASALAKSGKRDEALVAGRDALSRARAVKEDDIRVIQRTAVTLRDMFPVDRPADFEAYVTQVGEPTPVEIALLADTWNRIGPPGADKCLEWCSKVEAMGDKVAPGIRATVALTKGNALYGKGDLNGAADAFLLAATTTPGNAAALNNAAYLLVRARGDTDRAFELASKAVVLAPAQPDYLDTLGYVLLKANKLSEAEDALTKSVAVTSTPTALLHLAQVRMAQGNASEARQLLERAKQRQPDPETAKEIAEFEESLKGK
jgi:tetratricopeptide (TPR) repeat protein